MNGAKLGAGAMQGVEDERGLVGDCLGQASRAIYAHCIEVVAWKCCQGQSFWTASAPQVPANKTAMHSFYAESWNVFLQNTHQNVYFWWSVYSLMAKCVKLLHGIKHPWLTNTKSKKGERRENSSELLFPCVLTCIAIYIRLIWKESNEQYPFD